MEYGLIDKTCNKLVQSFSIVFVRDGYYDYRLCYNVQDYIDYMDYLEKEKLVQINPSLIDGKKEYRISYELIDTPEHIGSLFSARYQYEEHKVSEKIAILIGQNVKTFRDSKQMLKRFLEELKEIQFESVDNFAIIQIDFDRLKNDITYDPIVNMGLDLSTSERKQLFKSKFRKK